MKVAPTVLFAAFLCPLRGAEPPGEAPPRPASWAQPLRVAGVPNLHKVDDRLYRSGQPTAEGFRNLRAMGIRTVVNLRAFHSDKDEIKGTGLRGVHIRMKAWDADEDEAVRFLKIVTDPAQGPVLVHCQHGSDRTGTMCALYRIVVQGRSVEDAVREMTDGGYGFHGIWTNLTAFVRRLDIEAIRRKAGVPDPADKP